MPLATFFKNCREVLPATFFKNCREVLPATFFKKLSWSASCTFLKNCREVFPATFMRRRLWERTPERPSCRHEVFWLPCLIQQPRKTDRTVGRRKENLTLLQVATWINMKCFVSYLLGKSYVLVEKDQLS